MTHLYFKKLVSAINNNRLFVGLLSVFFILGLILGVVRYITYIAGFDYSIFTQTLWHYSQFGAPHSSIRDVNNILGDHFHPLLIVLTPLFWLWNNPLVLTVVQSITFALSAVPIYVLGRKHFGRNNALLISTAYLLSHGLQYALFFDFHEIALAVPIVAWLIYSIDVERYKTVILCCVLLCLLKEELVLLSAMVGVVLILKKRKYKLGTGIFIGSLMFFVALTKLIMPWLAGKTRYNQYWTYDSYGSSFADMAKNALTKPIDFSTKLYRDVFQNSVKTSTLLTLVLSSGITMFFSWYILLAAPNLAVRMLSDRGTFYWSYWFHYGAILMPIIFFCFIDVLRKIQVKVSPKVVTALCVALCIYSIGLMMNKNFPFAQVINPEFYSLNSDVRSGEAKVQEIVGKNSSVTAPVVITPHFANRESIHLLTDKGRWYNDENIVLTGEPITDFVVLNTKLPITDVEPYYTYDHFKYDLEHIGYKIIHQDDQSGWIVYKKLQ